MSLLYLPFVLQGTIMALDEHFFHARRELPLWERIGHPLDTLSVLAPLSIPAFFGFAPSPLKFFIGLSLFSCLFITKDEFVHAGLCQRGEHWLHALLFVLHPLTFLAAFLMWRSPEEVTFLRIQFALVALFMFYQILRSRGHDSIKKL